MEKLGVDRVKQAVKVALDIVIQYKKANEDGKITPLEYLGFVDEALALVKVIPHGKTILLQLEDLDSEERVELIAYVERFGVLEEKAVLILNNVLHALERLYDVWEENIVPIIQVLKKE